MRRDVAALVASQWRAVGEPARLLAAAPRLARTPRGDGSTVVVLPGHTTGDPATAALRAFLRRRGWDAVGWGLGTNDASTAQGEEVVAMVRRTAAGRGPVALVGWSFGGTYARAAAERVPALVRRVVTFGSPVWDGLAATSPVPVTALVSRDDGVVPYDGQVDDRAGVEVREVGATHVGMLVSPDVWWHVATALAAP